MTEATRIKRLFRDAIRRGTGRAYLLMREHPQVNFGPDIVKAAQTNFAYDPQCEQSRGSYLLELIMLLKPVVRREKTIQQVLAALVAARDSSWGVSQLFDLTRQLADEGYATARAAFYQRFELGSTPEFAYAGEYELVLLDGLAGLLRIAELRGRMLAADPEDIEDDNMLEFAQQRNPDVAVEAGLEQAAATSEHIACYLRAVRKNQQLHQQRLSRPVISAFDSVQAAIASPTFRYLPPHTIRKLTLQQLGQLAAAFEQEKNRARQAQYFRIFGLVKNPLGHEKMLQLAAALKPSRYSSALDDAVDALSFFQAPAIRELALAKLADSPAAWRYVSLLINNYQTDDDRLLRHLVEQHTDEHIIESLAISMCAVYQKNRTRKCLEPLRAIYQRMNCGLHRADVVELLLKRGVLPADIAEEIPFDSYEGVRELAADLPA